MRSDRNKKKIFVGLVFYFMALVTLFITGLITEFTGSMIPGIVWFVSMAFIGLYLQDIMMD